MSQTTTTRDDIRQEVRDNIQETSGQQGAIWSDALLNRHIAREIRSLPKYDIYNEQLWTTTTVVNQYDYVLPIGTEKVESVEINGGSVTLPVWSEINGVDNYAGALYLPYRPSIARTLRIKIKKQFTVPTDDVTALDVDDDVCEVVTWGVTLRCYKMLIGYLRGSQSWDSVTKPGDLTLPTIQAFIRDAEKYYHDMIQEYATVPLPRDIDLT
jgi:hypothetical protein